MQLLWTVTGVCILLERNNTHKSSALCKCFLRSFLHLFLHLCWWFSPPQNNTSQLNRLKSYQLHSAIVVSRGVKQSKHSAKSVCVFVCRQEFCSEACPDLTKEVYLQDIHCVGSLCKLYFRELPNPLLTYELYSKFTVSTFKSHLLSWWGRGDPVWHRSGLTARSAGHMSLTRVQLADISFILANLHLNGIFWPNDTIHKEFFMFITAVILQ